MVKLKFLALTFLVAIRLSVAQTIPVNRVYDWKNAGLAEPLPSYSNTLNMQSLGADMTGLIPCDGVFLSAINQCTVPAQSYTILFPSGVYTFTNTINLKSNVKLEGAGTTTRLIFTNSVTCINVQGIISGNTYSITQSASRYNRYLISNVNASSIQLSTGDFIILKQRAASLVTSTWAYNSVGQFLKITNTPADTLKLNHQLRKDYLITDTITFYKTFPIQNTGIKCMHITRRNTNVGSYPTIQFLYAYNCYVEGVEMDSCFFSHITFESSGNCQVSGSYFHDAYDYGGNGRAYGIAFQFNSSDHKIENNVFDHQRHSILMQAGINGNVIDYNYSINPYWTGTSLPANSAGDMVLHGNYVFANLFEGNVCQHMVIDNSHGINGPDNVFFRNRAQGYGIFMNSGPASNNQVFVGNEITNTTFLMGNYTLAGTGHFEFGNLKQGVLTPGGTSNLPDMSYCYNTKPAFLTGSSWPAIGIPNTYNTGSIPAQVRNGNATKTECNALSLNMMHVDETSSFDVYPNPASQFIKIANLNASITEITITTLSGKLVCKPPIAETIDISGLTDGVYFISLKNNKQYVFSQKIIVAR